MHFNKKDSSLKDAIYKSSAKDSEDVKIYYQMNIYLKKKALVQPYSAPSEKDFFYKAIVTPQKIIMKSYNPEIEDLTFEALKKYPKKIFRPQDH